MGRLLSNKNLPTPTSDGQLLKGDTSGKQYWGSGGGGGISSITSAMTVFGRSVNTPILLTNATLPVNLQGGSSVTINNILIAGRSADTVIENYITHVT